ncbi:hypothetical protein LTS17_004735 [Exophiala oligosperma]
MKEVVTFDPPVKGIVILILISGGPSVAPVTAIMLDVIFVVNADDFGPTVVIVVSGDVSIEAVTVRVCIITDGIVELTETITVTVTVATLVLHGVVVDDVSLFTAVMGKIENSRDDSDDKTDGSVIFGNAPRWLIALFTTKDDSVIALEGASTITVVFMYAVCVRVAVIQIELGTGGKGISPEEDPLELPMVGATMSGGTGASVIVVVTVAFMTCAGMAGRGVVVVEFRIIRTDTSCAVEVNVLFEPEIIAVALAVDTRDDDVLISPIRNEIEPWSESDDVVVGVYDVDHPVPTRVMLSEKVSHEVATGVRVVGMTLAIPSVMIAVGGSKVFSGKTYKTLDFKYKSVLR